MRGDGRLDWVRFSCWLLNPVSATSRMHRKAPGTRQHRYRQYIIYIGFSVECHQAASLLHRGVGFCLRYIRLDISTWRYLEHASLLLSLYQNRLLWSGAMPPSATSHLWGCILYFSLFMAVGCTYPFMPLIWRSKGFSGELG